MAYHDPITIYLLLTELVQINKKYKNLMQYRRICPMRRPIFKSIPYIVLLYLTISANSDMIDIKITQIHNADFPEI
jgi:hypothetical protein